MTVLRIGLDGVRCADGRRAVDADLARAALDWIDEPVGLYDGRPVRVAGMWHAVMAAALGEHCESVVLVHPDDWPPHRIARVVAAANTVADRVRVLPEGRRRRPDCTDPADPPSRSRRRGAVPAITAVIGLICLTGYARVAGLRHPDLADRAAGVQTVVEGRIAIELPAHWGVIRVTGGPGSRRLQAGPPGDSGIAVHITQAYAPESTIAAAAVALGRLIAGQPAGVFADFQAEAQVAGRAAVTYREVRPDRVIDWSVVQVGATRLAVGCQRSPGRGDEVRPVCDGAIASAREVGQSEAQESGTDAGPAAS